ncbi:MAG: hypothetical protein K8H88_20260 [Sandaracinaceae bacterium]|nr:hypothetical protein [Sandaracinaceae bacterium]
MASREIVVSLSGETSSFAFTKVDRAKLYGRRERLIEDEQGNKCVSAYLTADGAALVPPGGTAHVYVDEAFDTVERGFLLAVDDAGKPLAPVASTLGVAQELLPARPERLLDCVIDSVYQLDASELGPQLEKALADGELFEAGYRYRDGYDSDSVFLLQNEEGLFALVGRDARFEYLQRELIVQPEAPAAEDEDDLDQDLDFSMM